ncbi:MAG: amino acid ABC transporter permease [Alphaproteobacteria bacterium]|nr:amino acid ABC transporter permease [Alphaproteobacteria bacterium]
MADSTAPRTGDTSILNNLAFRGVAYQILLAMGVVLVGWYLYSNVNANLDRQGIATGFEFLEEAAGFDIGESLIPFDSSQSYGRIILAGILNTLHVAVVGIVLATILGVLMGIARVSRNWLISKLASAYVEVCRNVPVVLHVIFWASIIRNLPPPREAFGPFAGIFITNRGIIYPIPVENPVYPWLGMALVLGIIGAVLLTRWARKRREQTGQYMPTFWPGFGLVVGLPLLVWLVAGAPLQWDMPALKGFNFRGGSSMTPEFVALLIGITVYTAAFIAEIVRAGIQSVPHGQVEAARSLGLRPGLVMRLVVLPQALRVIVPPTTSQYLSLTKNSSLGVLIGYPDLVNVGNTTLNQTGQAVEAIAVMMVVYLLISLSISVFMNVYNRLVAIKER